MLEILLVLALVKKVGRMVEEKGHSAGAYKAYTVILWIGGEILGLVIGMALDFNVGAYGLALLGAGAGAAVALAIARRVKHKQVLPDAAAFD